MLQKHCSSWTRAPLLSILQGCGRLSFFVQTAPRCRRDSFPCLTSVVDHRVSAARRFFYAFRFTRVRAFFGSLKLSFPLSRTTFRRQRPNPPDYPIPFFPAPRIIEELDICSPLPERPTQALFFLFRYPPPPFPPPPHVPFSFATCYALPDSSPLSPMSLPPFFLTFPTSRVRSETRQHRTPPSFLPSPLVTLPFFPASPVRREFVWAPLFSSFPDLQTLPFVAT